MIWEFREYFSTIIINSFSSFWHPHFLLKRTMLRHFCCEQIALWWSDNSCNLTLQAMDNDSASYRTFSVFRLYSSDSDRFCVRFCVVRYQSVSAIFCRMPSLTPRLWLPSASETTWNNMGRLILWILKSWGHNQTTHYKQNIPHVWASRDNILSHLVHKILTACQHVHISVI